MEPKKFSSLKIFQEAFTEVENCLSQVAKFSTVHLRGLYIYNAFIYSIYNIQKLTPCSSIRISEGLLWLGASSFT